MRLSQIAKIIQGQLQGQDAKWQGSVCTDSRQLQPGQLFIAINGEKFDAHNFIPQAQIMGAVAAVVSRQPDQKTNLPLILVNDTTQALADLARHHRQQFDCPVIAVTGSCGKTTSKMLMASVFSRSGMVLSNPASFNNAIGVPLTLLQLNAEHDYAITELGANHPGEIGILSPLVQPEVAIITNAAMAHLEGFGDVSGVARTKGEIFKGLKADGVAILNADDAQISYWRTLLGSHRVITFGLENPADITATQIEFDERACPRFQLSTPQGQCQVQLPLLGRHNIYNALVAAAAATVFNIDLELIRQGLENAAAVTKRLVEYCGHAGATIIDDTYNANPTSMLAAIQLLTQRSAQTILVMGDMLELGEKTDEFHRQVGIQAKKHGVKRLFCLGKHSEHAAQAFGEQGFSFDCHEQLIDTLKSQLQPDITVLVKGSRGMTMEKVVAAIKQET